jgi:hypothetical protein
MIRQWLRIFFMGSGIILLFAPMAHAWGAGVHLAIGNNILGSLGLISPLIAEIICKHKNAFLYGCLSADIFIGKGCRTTPTHSHNWSIGLKLLDFAPTPQFNAYAYGYLSHLAADTIAHNYFVPNMLASTPGSGKLSHVYIEMQADMYVPWDPAKAKELFKKSYKAEDARLLCVTEKKKLSFYVKKQLYRGGILASNQKTWNTSLSLMHYVLPRATDPEYFEQMFLLSQGVVQDFLTDPQKAFVLNLDPVGTANLRRAHITRRQRRRFLRQGKALPVFTIAPQLQELVQRSTPQPFSFALAANDK